MPPAAHAACRTTPARWGHQDGEGRHLQERALAGAVKHIWNEGVGAVHHARHNCLPASAQPRLLRAADVAAFDSVMSHLRERPARGPRRVLQKCAATELAHALVHLRTVGLEWQETCLRTPQARRLSLRASAQKHTAQHVGGLWRVLRKFASD